MGVYNTGSVNVVVGSSTVRGNNTRFDSYAIDGNSFRLTNDAAFYEIADVVSSLEITLTSRYANSSHEIERANEHLATVTLATKIYSGTLSHTPIILNSLNIVASVVKWEDNGAGVLATTAGASIGIAGTINYDSGSWTVSVNSTAGIATSVNFEATYNSGASLNSMPYQIVTDYTPHFGFPEISKNDADPNAIVTRSLRKVDSRLYNASISTATVGTLKIRSNGYIQLGSHQYVFFGSKNTSASVIAEATSLSATLIGSLYLSSAGSFWKFTSNATATAI